MAKEKIKTLKDFGIRAFQSLEVEELEFVKHDILKKSKFVVESCSDSIKGSFANNYYIVILEQENKRYKSIFGGSVTYKQLTQMKDKNAFPCEVALKSAVSENNFEYEFFE